MLTAQDMSYDEARNLHSKWQKHQAFMAELASNKDWLDKIDKVYSHHVPVHYISYVPLNTNIIFEIVISRPGNVMEILEKFKNSWKCSALKYNC